MSSPRCPTALPAFATAVRQPAGPAAGQRRGLQAQNLQELYEAARAYDATYLAARSLAESAEFKAAQADALACPVGQSHRRSATRRRRSTPSRCQRRQHAMRSASASGPLPAVQPRQRATLEQASGRWTCQGRPGLPPSRT
jgi:outer membrane protein